MKRTTLLSILVIPFLFLSCSKDDDGLSYQQNKLNYNDTSYSIANMEFKKSFTISRDPNNSIYRLSFQVIRKKDTIQAEIYDFIQKPVLETYGIGYVSQESPDYILDKERLSFGLQNENFNLLAKNGKVHVISLKPVLELKFEGTFTDDQPFKGYYKGAVELPQEWLD